MAIGFTLRQLEYFEAVASEGSLTGASNRCHVTPSALTLAIDELERHLGLQLLVRRKGLGVTLTAVGTRMLIHARGILTSVDALSSDASTAADVVSGRFAVGCFTTLAPFFVPAIVDKFDRDYPDVQLEIATGSASDLHAMALQGRIDVAAMYSVDVPSALAFEPVLEYRPHVLVSAGHAFASRTSVYLRELAAEPLIVLDVPPTRQNTEAIFAQVNLTPRVGRVLTSFEGVRCLVGYGLGYAILFQRPATTTTYDGHQVRVVEIADAVPATVVGLARPRGAPRSARHEALRDFLTHERMGAERAVAVPIDSPGRFVSSTARAAPAASGALLDEVEEARTAQPVGISGHLREFPNETRAEIARALDIPKPPPSDLQRNSYRP